MGKYSIDPKNPYSSLIKLAGRSSQATAEAADAGYVSSALPVILKDKFRQAGDPALDAAISEKGQQVLGGAIQGLDKYRDISDPFTRRALAEKYQGGLSIGLDSLTSEKERRQGKFEEYITKWSGLYGAEAARKQALATAATQEFNTNKSLADSFESNNRWNAEQTESKRRWNIEQGEKSANKGKEASSKYQSRLNEIEDDVRVGKYSRETAKVKLQNEFPDKNADIIYDIVPDGYEKTPYSEKYFNPKSETPTGSERNATNTADVRDYYNYLLSVDPDQAKEYKKQHEYAF